MSLCDCLRLRRRYSQIRLLTDWLTDWLTDCLTVALQNYRFASGSLNSILLFLKLLGMVQPLVFLTPLCSILQMSTIASTEMKSPTGTEIQNPSEQNAPGSGGSSVVEFWTRDRNVAGSSSVRSGERILFSWVIFLCWLLFRYAFHPTIVEHKRYRPFCQ